MTRDQLEHIVRAAADIVKDDELIINLLSLCGELRTWRRVKDPYGKPKDFGWFPLVI